MIFIKIIRVILTIHIFFY